MYNKATLNLTINTSSSSLDNLTACDSYDWNGVNTLKVVCILNTVSTGCDSVATLNLTINNSSSSSDDVTSCDSYDSNGITYTKRYIYIFNKQFC